MVAERSVNLSTKCGYTVLKSELIMLAWVIFNNVIKHCHFKFKVSKKLISFG